VDFITNQPLQLTQVSQIIELSIILYILLGRRKRKLLYGGACQIEAAVLNKANTVVKS